MLELAYLGCAQITAVQSRTGGPSDASPCVQLLASKANEILMLARNR
jgi:hypothetical protein